MKKLILGVALALFVWACGGNSEETSTAGVDGAAIYKQNCVACHLANGMGGVNGAKDLRESALTVAERVNIITNGSEVNKTMVAYKAILSPKEIQAVAEYTMTLK